MFDSPDRVLARENAYRLLAASYYVPDQLLLEERPWASLEGVLAGLSTGAAAQARLMDAAAAASQESLKVEHARLFVGPFALVAPPYGSVYLDPGRSVMGESTVRVSECYRKHGFILEEDIHEPADHIAIELEFMSLLAFKHREALNSGDRQAMRKSVADQYEFLQGFLLPFLLPFSKAVHEDAEAPFYSALARCTMAFVEDDATSLASLLR